MKTSNDWKSSQTPFLVSTFKGYTLDRFYTFSYAFPTINIFMLNIRYILKSPTQKSCHHIFF